MAPPQGDSPSADHAIHKDDALSDAKPGAVKAPEARRIVVLGGAVTETVYALGAGADVIGVDTSSTYPPEASKLPRVGYHRKVSSESIISLTPTLVLLTGEAGPPAAIEQLRAAGVEVVQVPGGFGVEKARARIEAVSKVLNAADQGQKLIAALDSSLQATQDKLSSADKTPRVLFIYARGMKALMVSGSDTAADVMIELAGGVNAVEGFTGFRPLTPEAVVSAAPDILLMPTKGMESVGGVDGALSLPGLAETPAGKARAVIAVDDLKLLGFGPRTGEAVAELVVKLHPSLKSATQKTPRPREAQDTAP